MPKSTCKCCNQLYDNLLFVTCCICKEKYKNTCVDITSNELRILNSQKGYDWTCSKCRVIGNDLKELKALIISLQNDIKQLKAGNVQLETNPDADFEDILMEISDRQKRKNNIILFNVPEQDQSKPVTEQRESDKQEVMDILSIVDPSALEANVKPIRLGVFSESRTRPIKLSFQNEDTARKFLKNAKKIKTNAKYKNVNFSADKTKKQIEYYKKIKQELNDKINAGETNCRIKYINNVPRIVSEN